MSDLYTEDVMFLKVTNGLLTTGSVLRLNGQIMFNNADVMNTISI